MWRNSLNKNEVVKFWYCSIGRWIWYQGPFNNVIFSGYCLVSTTEKYFHISILPVSVYCKLSSYHLPCCCNSEWSHPYKKKVLIVSLYITILGAMQLSKKYIWGRSTPGTWPSEPLNILNIFKALQHSLHL